VSADRPIKDLDRVLEIKPVLGESCFVLALSHSNSIKRTILQISGPRLIGNMDYIDDKICTMVWIKRLCAFRAKGGGGHGQI